MSYPSQARYYWLAGSCNFVGELKDGDPIKNYGISVQLNNGCCQGLKSTTVKGSFRIYTYPLNWLPVGMRSEKAVLKMIAFLRELGAPVRLLSIFENSATLKAVEQANINLLAFIRSGNPGVLLEDIISSKKWICIGQEEYISPLHNYYVLCLIRFWFNKRFVQIFKDAFSIIDQDSSITPLEAFQIAHYAYPVHYVCGRGFITGSVPSYLAKNVAYKLENTSNLNAIFNEKSSYPYLTIHKLYADGNFREIKKLLTSP